MGSTCCPWASSLKKLNSFLLLLKCFKKIELNQFCANTRPRYDVNICLKFQSNALSSKIVI